MRTLCLGEIPVPVANSIASASFLDHSSPLCASAPSVPSLPVVRILQPSGSLPYDSNALFVVLTSSGIKQDGFCSSYCGWHSSYPASHGSTSVNLIFTGWAGDCNGGCSPFRWDERGNEGREGGREGGRDSEVTWYMGHSSLPPPSLCSSFLTPWQQLRQWQPLHGRHDQRGGPRDHGVGH